MCQLLLLHLTSSTSPSSTSSSSSSLYLFLFLPILIFFLHSNSSSCPATWRRYWPRLFLTFLSESILSFLSHPHFHAAGCHPGAAASQSYPAAPPHTLSHTHTFVHTWGPHLSFISQWTVVDIPWAQRLGLSWFVGCRTGGVPHSCSSQSECHLC